MTITVSKYNEENDSEHFNELSFDTLVSMKGIPPGMTRSEFYEQMVPLVNEYMNILEHNCILIAKDENSVYKGHIWFSLSEELEPWEFSRYYWLHNITIQAKFRHSGIGTYLMQHLEEVIRNQNSAKKKIGLHVNAENSTALKLYDKMNYSTYKTQLFYKNLEYLNGWSSKFQVFSATTEQEFENIVGLALFINRKKLPFDRTYEDLQKNLYNNFLKIRETGSIRTFYLKNSNDEVLGYFLLQESEMKYQKTAYISQFGFNPKNSSETLVDSMLLFAEKWAREREIEFIETVVYDENKNILNYLIEKGFKEFGYFKQKKLDSH